MLAIEKQAFQNLLEALFLASYSMNQLLFAIIVLSIPFTQSPEHGVPLEYNILDLRDEVENLIKTQA